MWSGVNNLETSKRQETRILASVLVLVCIAAPVNRRTDGRRSAIGSGATRREDTAVSNWARANDRSLRAYVRVHHYKTVDVR